MKPAPVAHTRGFTLIELLIVLAILAILAAISYPGYARHVQRAQRLEARTALLEAAHFMGRFRQLNYRYDRVLGAAGDEGATRLPAALRQVPPSGRPHHVLSIEHADASAFELRAQPVDPEDACGALALDHTGAFRVVASRPAADCWR